jgi:YHS domain-containing protein
MSKLCATLSRPEAYCFRRNSRMADCKKVFLVSAFAVCLSLLIFSGTSLGADQTQCPVMGGMINKNVYADYQGNRVYFCCPPCLKEFKRSPDLYIKKMKEQGITLAKTPDSGS